MKLGELMTRQVRLARADMTIQEAAQVMIDFNIGGLPVVNKGNLVGFVTDRDIILRVIAEGLDIKVTTVGEAMTQGVVKLGTEQDAAAALAIMKERKVHRVVVTDGGDGIAGILSLGDLAGRGGVVVENGQLVGVTAWPKRTL